MSDKCECPARGALELLLDGMYAVILPLPDSIRDAMQNGRAAYAAPCPCDQLRDELQAIEEAVGFFGNPGELAMVVKSALQRRDQLHAENAALTKTPDVDDWRKLIQLAYLDSGDGVTRIHRITAEYNRVRDENDKLRAENAALRKQVAAHQEWLEMDSQYAENQRLKADNAELRQQALSRGADMLQLLAVVDAAGKLRADDPHGHRLLYGALDDYQESQQEREA